MSPVANHDSSLSTKQLLACIAEVLVIGGTYIALSAGLISFNKFMLSPERFPHALELTALHMSYTFICSVTLYCLVPSIYPSMDMALDKKGTVLKYIAPLGLLFAVALYTSNKAYTYSTIAFLQFLKEGNVAIVFFMSCIVGSQTFSFKKIGVLAIVILGCSLCADGEIHFVMAGFLLQILSQFSECAKNIIGELVMSGQGLKLDPLTFVAFQAPCSLLPLLTLVAFKADPKARDDLFAHYPLLIANASVAFLLNVMIALTLKRLSALAFVFIGLSKDIVIVLASSVLFGDEISHLQRISFGITLFGMFLWAQVKMQEQAEAAEAKQNEEADVPEAVSETTPLIADGKKSETA
eukprot:TRINITY_DN3750_c1_g3_i3.p1 TRINITY_DN3750_c1_g3~~TRINITY_DN3750_c1_g3_i3.p1  ORF type:complete len:380 (+),score=84.92 TRINITY_DN3750_c1_g3_i3:82-1140(+)